MFAPLFAPYGITIGDRPALVFAASQQAAMVAAATAQQQAERLVATGHTALIALIIARLAAAMVNLAGHAPDEVRTPIRDVLAATCTDHSPLGGTRPEQADAVAALLTTTRSTLAALEAAPTPDTLQTRDALRAVLAQVDAA